MPRCTYTYIYIWPIRRPCLCNTGMFSFILISVVVKHLWWWAHVCKSVDVVFIVARLLRRWDSTCARVTERVSEWLRRNNFSPLIVAFFLYSRFLGNPIFADMLIHWPRFHRLQQRKWMLILHKMKQLQPVAATAPAFFLYSRLSYVAF